MAAPTNGAAARDRTEFYGGASRFELELEFVQSLSNPYYLNHLANQKYFEDEAFVAYCKYLKYFTQPPYLSYLSYPGPTLRILDLIQEEQFRKDLVNMNLIEHMFAEGINSAGTAQPTA